MDFVEAKIYDKLPVAVKTVYNTLRPKFANSDGNITVGKIIGLVVICIVIAYILPTALQALGNMNTSGMSAPEIALIGSIGIIVVLVIFAAIANEAQ